MGGVKIPATLMLAATVLTGCAPKNKLSITTETGANPVPVVETIAHGYETEDGTVVRYSDVETGKDSAKDGGQKDDYSDRATAK
jgi:ABC-type tungstate transport system permease subunit